MDRVWQGASLRKMRMVAGQSIAGLAKACGVNHSTVSQWELGMTTPGQRHLERMAQLYGMPLELLLYEIGYEIANPPSLRAWYKARSGITTAGASGTTAGGAAGNAASKGPGGDLPLAYGPFAPVLVGAAAR